LKHAGSVVMYQLMCQALFFSFQLNKHFIPLFFPIIIKGKHHRHPPPLDFESGHSIHQVLSITAQRYISGCLPHSCDYSSGIPP